MHGMALSTEELTLRRRKLRYRSWHRGMRELDLIFGPFADRFGETLTEAEIGQYEALLEIPDTEMLDWMTGRVPLPDALDTPLMARIMATGRA
ncbi:MAG: succinate dehydrogenase assembly factor 2 [Rhizobiaceae bacterium]|nr:succinate dehydrogenase assembly factor 2 [Rhizobiaceae bacterium]